MSAANASSCTWESYIDNYNLEDTKGNVFKFLNDAKVIIDSVDRGIETHGDWALFGGDGLGALSNMSIGAKFGVYPNLLIELNDKPEELINNVTLILGVKLSKQEINNLNQSGSAESGNYQACVTFNQSWKASRAYTLLTEAGLKGEEEVKMVKECP